jgi:uncharacterized protein YaaN involved in tellurite resistance
MSDEPKIALEDVKEKFETVMESIQMINEKLDRHIDENRKEHEKFEMGLLEFRRDLNEHRNNTELHRGRRGKKKNNFVLAF